MPKSNQKGGAFERMICKQLSLWWSGGASDGLFWRTACSGGRATVRTRKGMRTENQYGDITATSMEGAAFTKLVCCELKRGYKWNPLELLNNKCRTDHPLIVHVAQAREQAVNSKSPWWWLVFQQDRHDVMVVLPHAFWSTYCQGKYCRMIFMNKFRIVPLSDLLKVLSADLLRKDAARGT